MKKALMTIMAAIMISAFAVTAEAAVSGDVNGDGSIAVDDAVTIINSINGVNPLTAEEEKAADCDGSDKIDIADAVAIINHVNGITPIENKLPDDSGPEKESETLVIYFSRTGNTQKIAGYLTELADADSYVIEAAVSYTDADIKYQDSTCRANKEQNDKAVRPEIAEPIESIDEYDIIFLGYPIWWGQEPRIIDTFLESYDFSDKTVIPFCTSGSSGIETSEKNISELVTIGDQLAGRRFPASATKEDVKAWYDTLPLKEEKTDNKLKISINGTELTATLADSTAAKELAEKLKAEPVTVTLNEYGGFEKVGKLPWSLTKTDESIVTEAGDIMLYQGDQMTIFYNSNSWSYTKLGHIDNITQDELKAILGDGNVTVTLSIK